MHPTFDQMTTAERILHVRDLWDKIAAATARFSGCRISDHMRKVMQGVSFRKR